eukprot:COSAG01_NODE_36577_length_515_cov_5.264423_1_plen_44_part_10
MYCAYDNCTVTTADHQRRTHFLLLLNAPDAHGLVEGARGQEMPC